MTTKIRFIKLTSLMLLWLMGSTISAQGIEFEHGTVAEVLQKAKSSNKLVFVDCFTTWCGPCKWLSANVFTKPEVGKYFNEHFVNYKLDMEKGEGIAFADKYEVRAYPTLLFLDGNGNMVHAAVGSMPAEEFLELGKKAQDPNQQVAGVIKKYEDGDRSVAFLTQYITKMNDVGMDVSDAVHEWSDLVKASELLVNESYWNIFMSNFRRVDTDKFQYLLQNRAAFEGKYGKEAVEEKISGNYTNALSVAMYEKDEAKIKQVCDEFRKASGANADRQITLLEMGYAERSGDMEKFVSLASASAEKYFWDDWSQLNSLAWSFYESVDNKKDLEKAAKWAARSVELNAAYYNLDTYGMLQKKLGNKKEAIKYLEKAIEAAKASGDDYSATQEGLDELKGK